MGRAFSCTGSYGDGGVGKEWFNPNHVDPTPTINTTDGLNADGYCFEFNLNGSSTRQMANHRYVSGANGLETFGRWYVRAVTVFGGGTSVIGGFSNLEVSGGAAPRFQWKVSAGVHKIEVIRGSSGSGVSVHLFDAALTVGEWYRVELRIMRHATTPNAGQDIIAGRLYDADDNLLDEFADTATSIAVTYRNIMWGVNLDSETHTTLKVQFTNIAVNDTTGSVQNSWCGAGKTAWLRPNAAGEFSNLVAMTGGGTFPYESWDESPSPDDATTYLTFSEPAVSWSDTNGSRVMVGMDALPETPASISFVALGARVWNNSASGSAHSVGCQTSNGGTKSETASATWASQVAGPWASHILSSSLRNYLHTMYTDPDGAAWAESSVNSLQVGIRAVDASPDFMISQVWALVEYVPQTTRIPVLSNHYRQQGMR